MPVIIIGSVQHAAGPHAPEPVFQSRATSNAEKDMQADRAGHGLSVVRQASSKYLSFVKMRAKLSSR